MIKFKRELIILFLSGNILFLSGCSKEVSDIETINPSELVASSVKVLNFKDKEDIPTLQSIIDNPQSFIEYLPDSNEIQVQLDSLREDDIEACVEFDENGNVINYTKMSLNDYKNISLSSILLSRYISYATQYTLDSDVRLLNQKVLRGEFNTSILQTYSNNQIALIQFKSSSTIESIDIFTPIKLENTKTINHYNPENIPIDFKDTITQRLYNALTSTSKPDYINNLCYCQIDSNLLLQLSEEQNTFSIIDCFKSDNTMVFIDEYNGKHMLIKCILSEDNKLIDIQYYE